MKKNTAGFKKILLLSLIASFSRPLPGQKITGTIENGTGDSIIYFDYNKGLLHTKDSAVITDNKTFIKHFKFIKAENVFITYHSFQKNIYVFPDAELTISFNAMNDSLCKQTFAVTGDCSINQYLDTIITNQVHNHFIYDRAYANQPIDSLVTILHDFRIFSDSLRHSFFLQANRDGTIKPLQNFLITDSINWYSNSILQAIDYLHFTHTGNRRLFWQQEVKDRLPATFSNAFTNAGFYTRLWPFFFQSQYEIELEGADSVKADQLKADGFMLQYLQSKNIGNAQKEFIASQALNEILFHYTDRSVGENKHYDSSIIVLKKMIADKPFLEDFDKQYNEKKDLLYSRLSRNKAPDFLLSDTAGKIFTLADFKGKIILIDAWATWCAPCVAEMPHLKMLMQKLKANENFRLLSVSLDESKKTWIENGVLRLQPPGLLLWQAKDVAFSKAYDIRLIPRLILIDKEGNFIDYNPPKASEGDRLYQLILEKLNG